MVFDPVCKKLPDPLFGAVQRPHAAAWGIQLSAGVVFSNRVRVFYAFVFFRA